MKIPTDQGASIEQKMMQQEKLTNEIDKLLSRKVASRQIKIDTRSNIDDLWEDSYTA